MRIRTLTILSILLLSKASCAYCSDKHSYGLTFRSHNTNQDDRTSLDLGGGHAIRLPSGASLSFDLRLERANLTYGYVFRMVSSDMTTLDLVANSNANKLQFVLIKDQAVLANTACDLSQANKYGWKHVNVSLNDDSICCRIDSCTYSIPHSFGPMGKVNIYFGKNWHPLRHTNDVPPVTVRDISLKDKRGELLYCWPLSRHDDNWVYDKIHHTPALVENGVWEIDRYAHWHKEASFSFDEKNPQIAYDSVHARVFVATRDSLLIHHLQDGITTRLATTGQRILPAGGSRLIYDHKRDKLLFYCHENRDLAIFDFARQAWNGFGSSTELLPLTQQHNRFIHPETGTLYIFGGYGNHYYNSDLIAHDPAHPDVWTRTDLASLLPPRYLSALGYVGDNTFFIMGGHGSLSGKQEEAMENYNDIRRIEFGDSIRSTTLGTLRWNATSMAFGNSMVVDTAHHTLYALTYNDDKYRSHIQLLSYDWKSHEQFLLADTIPYNFLDIESYCDLFLHRQSTLYAIVLHETESTTHYAIDIYSLAYPPLSLADTTQSHKTGFLQLLFYISGGCFLLALGGGFLFFRHRKRKGGKPRSSSAEAPAFDAPIKRKEQSKSCIRLLGGFQVIDRNGVDITNKFTPILKHMFLLILLTSTQHGKKVTSERLDETFWEGMEKGDASNNRNVNIRKLRLLLGEVGDIAVVSKCSYWSIQRGDGVTIDYLDLLALLQTAKESETPAPETLESVLSIALEGRLLPNVMIDWVDMYKREYTDMIVEYFTGLIHDPAYERNHMLRLHMANLLLLHDCIDENAVRVKCTALSRMKQKGIAKQCYDKFYADYEHLLNERPNFTYDDIFQ